jgi:hypothetical protein
MKYLSDRATHEMNDRCSVLREEMQRWPGVKMYHLFGTCAFYQRKEMFAVLPDKRSLSSTTAISFKAVSSGWAGAEVVWRTFELVDSDLLDTALSALKRAYSGSCLCSTV